MRPQAVYAATKWGLRGWSLSCYEVCLPSDMEHCVVVTLVLPHVHFCMDTVLVQ